MLSFDLNAVEKRILGCLLEKERITPENYPLSLHSLTVACNQATNRDPVVSYSEKTVEAGVNSLREKKLARVIFGTGSRVQKYRHNILEHFNFGPGEVALLCVLLLRGPQTPGELRGRAERLHAFGTLAEVEACLEELARDAAPLVRVLPARPGQKERRYEQLLSAESLLAEPAVIEPAPAVGGAEQPGTKVEIMEKEVAVLKAELHQLREEFAQFRKQFE
ncbi:MAG: YceH family protein [Verrucomicrobiota bacterium]|nr:YceH family protein [Verrucomicrobiota bacterium]